MEKSSKWIKGSAWDAQMSVIGPLLLVMFIKDIDHGIV